MVTFNLSLSTFNLPFLAFGCQQRFIFLSLLAAGGIFQACDDSKTYAEMLEDEKNAVNKFIKDKGIRIISQDEFEKNDTVTNLDRNEYVALSDGVYMQIVDRGSAENKTDTFANNNEICVRYIEEDIMTRDTTCYNVFLEEWGDANQLYTNPAVFRYVAEGSYVYGTFIQMDYYWASYYQSTAVPAGWLLALPFVRNYAHVRLIVPSKVGHSSAQQLRFLPFHQRCERRVPLQSCCFALCRSYESK